MEILMKVIGIIIVATILLANTGIIDAKQLPVSAELIPLSEKIIRSERITSRVVMPYMESKSLDETELSYAVHSVAKKTINEQLIQEREVESQMRASIEDHNRNIRSTPKRDFTKNPYTRKEIEKQIIDSINFSESIKYSVNDKEYYNRIDVNEINDLSGFPKKVPSFAKKVDIHLKPPKAIEDGGYIQVSFAAKPLELKPYIEDAENHAKVILTMGEAKQAFIKPFEDLCSNYTRALSTILPEQWIEVTNIYNNMYQYKMALSAENIKQKVDSVQAQKPMMDPEMPNAKLYSDKILSNDENKALQKKYLGYYSFKEIERPFTEDYKFYIFKFDYRYGGYTVAGMAVNPEQTRVIYFIQTIR